jgi:excisionase family DNA binding protein
MTMNNEMKLLLTTREACVALGIKRSKLFQLLAEGRLDRRRIGGKVLLPVESVRAFAAGLPTGKRS